MKIRTGFVSNSSSSSFCIAGVYMSKRQFVGFLKKHNVTYKEWEITGDDVGGMSIITSDGSDEYLVGVWIEGDYDKVIEDIKKAKSVFPDGKIITGINYT